MLSSLLRGDLLSFRPELTTRSISTCPQASASRGRRRASLSGQGVSDALPGGPAGMGRFYDPSAFVYAFWPMVRARRCQIIDAIRLGRLPMTLNSAGEPATIGEHAIVLGASMAGLLAARVLAGFYAAVTLVERDTLEDTAVVRRGVPQARHAHGLLMRGAQALEELFPGLNGELADDGAEVFDGTDLSKLYFSMNGHLAVRAGSAKDLRSCSMTRPSLECHVRRRVR